MSDIVERLRAMASDLLRPYDRLALEAAAEIERLRNVIKADFYARERVHNTALQEGRALTDSELAIDWVRLSNENERLRAKLASLVCGESKP